MKKRLLSLLLAFAMVFSLLGNMSTSEVFADTGETVQEDASAENEAALPEDGTEDSQAEPAEQPDAEAPAENKEDAQAEDGAGDTEPGSAQAQDPEQAEVPEENGNTEAAEPAQEDEDEQGKADAEPAEDTKQTEAEEPQAEEPEGDGEKEAADPAATEEPAAQEDPADNKEETDAPKRGGSEEQTDAPEDKQETEAPVQDPDEELVEEEPQEETVAPAKEGETDLDDIIKLNDFTDQTYTGFPIEPEITLIGRGSFDASILVKDTDYTVSYVNNKNVGTATVTVTGIGDYKGKTSKTFDINAANIESATIAEIGNQIHTGEALTPEIALSLGAYNLVEGSDYDVAYADNIQEGNATITVTGKGNFTGTKTVTFAIVKAVAKIGEAAYESFEAAVTAANAMTGVVTIDLLDNVTWTTGASHGSTPLLTDDSSVTKLSVNGNGKTLTAVGDGIGSLRAANNGTLSFSDMTIEDASVSYAEGSWEHGYLEFAGNLEFDHVDFVNAIMLTRDNGQQENCDASFKNCTFNSNAADEYDIWVSQGEAYFEDCTFTGYRGAKTHEAYGSEVEKLEFKNCEFKDLTKKPGLAVGMVNAETTVIFDGCKWNNVQPGDQEYYLLESDTPVTNYNLVILNDAKVDGEDAAAIVARIGNQGFLAVPSAFVAAKTGDVLEILKAGNYTLPSIPNITVKGNVEGVVFSHLGPEYSSVASIPNGATFNHVTFNFGNVNYHGFQHAGTINMVDCTINGRLTSYGNMNFTECTFNAPIEASVDYSKNDYSMWAYSGNLTYTDCTFNGAGKFLNVYNESGATRYTISAEGCSFNSSTSNKAAFNVKESKPTLLLYTININNCTTAGSFPAAGESTNADGTLLSVISGLVQIDDRKAGGTMDGGEIVVYVDGEQKYITPRIARVASIGEEEYTTLMEAFAAAKSGDIINVYPGEVELPATAVIPANVTVKGAGTDATTLKITTANGDGVKITKPNVTISDVKIDGTAITSGGYKSLINVEADGCVIDNVVMRGGGTSTWNSSILVETLTADQTFTVKNSDITGSCRGVLRESCSANIVIDNCDIDAVYPFNIDGGSSGTVTVTDSKLHGWTSYSGVEKVTFTRCEFSKANSGYDIVAAYVDTEFNECTFDSGFQVYAQTSPFTFWFNDCEKAEEDITRENFTDKFTDSDVWIKCDTYVNGKLVGAVAEVVRDKEYKSLQKALDAAHEMTGDVTVKLVKDIAEVAIIRQKAGLNLTVDGAGKTITGQLYIDGDGRYEGTDTLTIQNTKFAYDAATYDDAFIDVPSTKTADKPYTTGKYNYAHNVTVKDCEFAGEGTTTVAVRVASGAGANKLTIDNNNATSGHSFAQLVGVRDLTVTDNTVAGVKNGINISGGDRTGTISGNTLTANGYTVRLKDASSMAVTLSDNVFSGEEGIVNEATGGGKITVLDGKYNGPLPTDAAKLLVKRGLFSTAPALAVCEEGLYPIANTDEATKEAYPYTVGEAVATITRGEEVFYFSTLESAFAAAKDGDTIKLLKDCYGNGMIAPQDKFATGLTVDFDGHTYDFSGKGVGSAGTEYNGFQLLMGNTITFKNGTIKATSEDAGFLIQNYSNLTLDNMTIDGTGVWGGYVISNNNGNVVIKDTTITAKSGDIAFDVCRYATYPAVSVTVEGNSTINGKIEVSASGNDAKDGITLALNGGTFNGALVLDPSAAAAMEATPDKVSITKANSVEEAAPAGYAWKDLGNGYSKLATPVAKIGDTLYGSLEDAVDAVTDGTATTITMIDNEAINVVGSAITIAAGKNITIDLNGFQVVGTADGGSTSALITNRGNLTIKDSSTDGTGKLISGATTTWIYDGSGNYAGSYASNTITNSGTLTVESGHIENLSTGSATYAIDNNSSGSDAIANITGGTVKAHSVAIRQFANSTTKENTVNVSGGTVTAGYSGIWVQLPGSDATKAMKATLNVTGGTIHGDSYAFYDYSYGNSFANTRFTLSGGTFEGHVFSYGANVTITDGTFNNGVYIQQNKPSTVSISGGTFEGYCYTYGENASTGYISGGKYKYEPYAEDVVRGKAAIKSGDYWIIGDAVAEIDGIGYATLEGAFADAEDGDTVVLLMDVTAEQTVYNGDKNFTFDLNEKTITGRLTFNGGTVTVENGEIVGRFDVYDTAVVTLAADATVTGQAIVWGDGTFGQEGCKTPTFNVYGTITNTGDSAISTNGTDMSGANINILDGAKVTSTDEIGIYQPSGNVTISGGTVTGTTAVYTKSGTLSITGGTLNATGAAAAYSFNGNGGDATGDALVVENCDYPNGAPTATITGGTFTSANGKQVAGYAGNGKTELADVTANINTLTIPENERWLAVEGGYKLVKAVTVTFNAAGGSETDPQTIAAGETATKPADPEKVGYLFAEWQLEGAAFDFAAPVTADIELVAVWTPVPLSLNYATRNVVAGNTGTALTVKINGVNATAEEMEHVTWTSSDETIVKVAADGTMVYVAPGVATVTAHYYESTADCVVTVKEADIEHTNAAGVVTYKTYSSTVLTANGTYKLLKDINATARLTPGIAASNVVLDLNGHTITSTAPDCAILLSRAGSASAHKIFAIVDTSAEKGGKLIATGLNTADITDALISATGKYNDITIGEGVTLEGGSIALVAANQTLTVNGTVKGNDDFAIATNGSASNGTTITINEGAVVTSDIAAIYLPAGTLNVEGGSITGGTGIFMRGGTLNIPAESTAVITGTGDDVDPAFAASGDGANTTGEAVTIVASGYPEPISVTIAGGKFASAKADAVGSYATDGNTAAEGFITGGLFTSAPALELCGKDAQGTQLYPIASGNAEYPYMVGIAVATVTHGDDVYYYGTLSGAVAAAQAGDTVELLADVTEDVSFAKALTIDLGGKTMTGRLTASSGEVTVKNGTVTGRLDAYDAATVTLAEDAAVNGQVVVWGDGTFGQDGCKTPTLNVYGTVTNTGDSAITTNGSDMSRANINIYDGAVVTSDDIAIYQPSGNVTVNGGSITGATAIYQKSGTLTVKGGTITGNGAKADYSFYGNGAYATGDAIVVESCDYPNGVPSTSIEEGAAITSANAAGIADYVNGEAAKPDIVSDINTITLPEGENWVANGQGRYVIGKAVAQIGDVFYASLKDAAAAAQDGDTIQMIADSVETGYVGITADVTIDLNGFTVSRTNGSALLNPMGANVILTDTSADKAGKVVSDIPVYVEDGSTFTMEAGTLEGTGWAAVYSPSGPNTINLNGGTVHGTNYAVCSEAVDVITIDDADVSSDAWGIVLFSGATLNVNSGTVTGTGQPAISTNGNNTAGSAITINGGAVTSNDVAIYQPAADTLTINGGEVTGTTAVYVKAGTVTVTGGTVTGNGAAADYNFNGNGANATGDAIVLDSCGYPAAATAPVAIISGGDIVSANASAIADYATEGNEKGWSQLTGGTYYSKKDIADTVQAEYPLAKYPVEVETDVYKIQYSLESPDIEVVTADGKKAYPYTGEEVTPELIVTVRTGAHSINELPVRGITTTITDGTVLVLNDDYTVAYEDNVEIGTASAIVTGTPEGLFAGTSTTRTFDIVVAEIDQPAAPANVVYNGAEQEPELTVTAADGAATGLVKGTDYTVTYKDAEGNDVTAPKNAGTYTVTVTGLAPHFSGEKTVAFKIDPKNIADATVAVTVADESYTGEPVESLVQVIDSETGTDVALIEGTDFTVDYSSNTNVGTALVTLTGIGNYTGTRVSSFYINPGSVSIGKAVVTIDPAEYLYTGEPIVPTSLVVKDTAGNVIDPKYYTVTYYNNVNAGTAVAFVVGEWGYTGGQAVSFTINPVEVALPVVTARFVYDGTEKTGVAPAEGTADLITIVGEPKATDVGSYMAVVSLNDENHVWADGTTAMKSFSWEIVPAEVIVTIEPIEDQLYTGSPVEPQVNAVAKAGDTVVDVPFRVEFANNDAVGTATVTVTVESPNYTGSATANFKIVGAVAKINDTYYGSLAAAVAAAQAGDTVELLADVTEDVSFAKALTIDLGGKTMTGRLTANSGEVTVKNGTVAGRLDAYDAATVTLAADAAVNGQVIVWGDGTFGQDGCKTPTLNVYGTVTNTGDSAISTNGSDMSGANINIYDGAVVTSDDIAIYQPSGNVTVNGGTITGATAIYQKSGTLTVKGGTITGNGAKADYSFNGNGANATGDAIVVESCDYPNGVPSTSIEEGAAITSVNAAGVGDYVNGEAAKPVVVSDTNTITLPEGENWVSNGEGRYVIGVAVAKIGDTVYASLAAAVAAAQDGDTIVMIADEDLAAQVVVGKAVTLDLDGHKLFNTADLWSGDSWSLISVQGGDLTITGNGAMEAKADDCYTLDIRDGGKLTIEDGTFVGNVTAVYVYVGEATINGGDFSLLQKSDYNDDRYLVNLYDANNAAGTARAVITGGTFHGFDPSDNLAEAPQVDFTPEGFTGALVEGETDVWTVVKQLKLTEIEAIDNVTYNDEAQTPAITVKDENGEVVAPENYTVVYENNKDAGTATVTATAAEGGSYYGTVTATFTIDKAVLTGATIADQLYTGSELKPVPTVKAGVLDVPVGGYEVIAYISNIEIGTGYEMIAGRGNFDGMIVASFKIVESDKEALKAAIDAAEAAMVAVSDQNGFDLEPGTKYTTSAEKQALQDALDAANAVYADPAATAEQIAEATNALNDAITAYKAVIKTAQAAVAKINDTYFTTLAAAVDAAQNGDTIVMLADEDLAAQVVVDKAVTLDLDGHRLFNTADLWAGASWSLISVQGGDLTITGNGAMEAKANDCYTLDIRDGGKLTIEDGTFVGNVTAVYVYVGEATINGGDFSLLQKSDQGDDRFLVNLYDANGRDGTAKAVITGGTFHGFDPSDNLAEAPQVDFTPEGFTGALVDGETDVWTVVEQVRVAIPEGHNEVYDGTEKNGVPEGEGYTLTLDADGPAVNAGEYKTIATLESKQYIWDDGTTETKEIVWNIVPADLSSAEIDTIAPQVYTGKAIEPAVKVTLGTELVKDTDYSVSYENNIETGVATVTIYGIGNYGGLARVYFAINEMDSKDLTMTLSQYTYDYDGTAHTPDVTITKGEGEDLLTLVEGTDYDLTVFNNVEPGTATVIATLKGNFEGHLTDTFVIKAAVAFNETTGKYYGSLAAAVAAANAGDTIVMLADEDLAAQVVVDKAVTLDLDGHKLFNTADLWAGASWSLISVQGGDLTITGNGTLEAKENDCYALDIRDGGKLTIEDGTFVGNVTTVYVFEGEATINGGDFSLLQKSPEGDDRFLVNLYDANGKNGTAKAVINGGTFHGFDPSDNLAEGPATDFTPEGYTGKLVDGETNVWTVVKTYTVTFDVKGGEPEVEAQVVAEGGNAAEPGTVPAKEGETFKEWTLDGEAYDFTAPVTGDITLEAVYTVNTYTVTFDENGGAPAVEAQTVEHNGKAVAPADPARDGMIFAGWYLEDALYDFDTEVTDSITLTAHWTEGVAKIGDTVYASLAAAVAAAQDGDTIVMLADEDLTAQVVVDKAVTLDLDGHKLFNTADLWAGASWSLISVQGGDLTITGNGTLEAKENDCYTLDIRDGGKLTIEDGTFVGNVTTVYVFEGEATINGGDFSLLQKSPEGDDRFLVNLYDANGKNGTAKAVINGGTFHGFDPSDNLAEAPQVDFTPEGFTGALVEGETDVWTVVKQLKLTEIEAIDNVTYNGEAQTPAITVKDENGEAVPAEAYELTWENNTDAGTATVTATAAEGGSYYGTVTATFTIDKAVLTEATIADDQLYTGSELKPVPTVKAGELDVPVKGYEVIAYISNIELGTGYEMIAGRGNFDGMIVASFKIVESDKEALKAAIDAAEAAMVAVSDQNGFDLEPGTKYTTGAEKQALQDALDAANAVYADPAATAEQIAEAANTLNDAVTAYKAVIKTAQAAVAKINDTYYTTLAAAVAAANAGDTIELLADVTDQLYVPADKDVTVDLAGHSITESGYDGAYVAGKLTVEDSVGGGKIASTTSNGISVVGGELTVNSGTIEAQEMAVLVLDAGKATINGGTFTAHDNAVLGTNGTAGRGGSTITVNDGTFNGTIQSAGYVACGIYAPNDDVWTVNGGTFNITGGAGIVARAGVVTVNGGEFNTTGNTVGKVGDSRVVVPCSAVVFDSEANYPAMTDASVINIAGGTFRSEDDTVTSVGDDAKRISITDGAFSDAAGNEVTVPEGKELRKDEGEELFTLKDIVLTVSFDAKGGDGSFEDQAVVYGGKAVKPATDPVKEGYTFSGWYAEGQTAEYDFETPVKEDLVLEAVFEINEYTVTFDVDGDTEKIPAQKVAFGAKAVKPADPEKEPYNFGGWMLDGKAYDFETPVKADITLTAVWNEAVAEIPVAADNLVYNKTEQTGVAAGTGYTVEGGKGTDARTYTATATLADGYVWADGTSAPKTVKWSIAPAQITEASVAGTYSYTGEAITDVDLTVKAGTLTLTAGEDCSVFFANNVEVGNATVVVNGKGNYQGMAMTSFQIVEADRSALEEALANLPETVAVSDKDGYDLDPEEDEKYTTSAEKKAFDDAVAAAEAVLADPKATPEDIADVVEALNEAAEAYEQAKKPVPSKLVVTFVVDGETVETQEVIPGEKAVEPEAPKKDGFIFKGWFLENAEEAYSFDTAVTAAIALTAQFEAAPVLPTETEVPVPEAGLVYNGTEQTAVAETDAYTVTGGKATNAGTYTATVTPKDGYVWTDGTAEPKEVKYVIAKAELTEAAVSGTYTYNGKAQDPGANLTVKADDMILTADDYNVLLVNNVDVGTASVFVTGKGNFKGLATATFDILPVDKSALEDALANLPEIVAVSEQNGYDLDPEEDEQYTTGEEKRAFEDAVKKAQDLCENPNVTAEEIAAAVEELNEAAQAYENAKKPVVSKFEVIFKADGLTVNTQYVVSGEKVVEPAAPNKTGYTFKYWALDGASYDFTAGVTGNMTLTAVYEINKYTVTFVVDGKTVQTGTVEYGKATPKPADPTKAHKVFAGWSPEVAQTVTANATYTAVWNDEMFTVTYMDGNGKTLQRTSVAYGSTLPAFSGTVPTRTGYRLDTANQWTPALARTVTTDLIYNLNWIKTVTVTVDPDNGSATTTMTIDSGSAVTGLKDPAKNGYIFTGWTLNGKAYSGTPITANVTLKAAYAKKLAAPVIKSLENYGRKKGIMVTWTADSKYEKFELQRKTSTGEWITVKDNLVEMSYQDRGADYAGETFSFRVRGYYAGTWMDYSGIKKILRNPFVDVSTKDSMFEAIMWAYNMDIARGGDADDPNKTNFSPEDDCTRGEFATMIWRMYGSPSIDGLPNRFSDVVPSKGHGRGIIWASSQKIIAGYDDGTFRSTRLISRSDMMVMLWKTAGRPKSTLTKNPFTDVTDGNSRLPALKWGYEHGIVTETTFRPKDNCTRRELANFLFLMNKEYHVVEDK